MVLATLCLQSTCTLSVTVAGLGFNLFFVGLDRALSGLVVVRRSGQALLDLPLPRSFQVLWSTATFLAGAGFLVAWLPSGLRGFRLVLARGWHGQVPKFAGFTDPVKQCQLGLDSW